MDRRFVHLRSGKIYNAAVAPTPKPRRKKPKGKISININSLKPDQNCTVLHTLTKNLKKRAGAVLTLKSFKNNDCPAVSEPDNSQSTKMDQSNGSTNSSSSESEIDHLNGQTSTSEVHQTEQSTSWSNRFSRFLLMPSMLLAAIGGANTLYQLINWYFIEQNDVYIMRRL